jgi:hypothetical protein
MRTIGRSLAGTTLAILASGSAALAAGTDRCTQAGLSIDGQPIAATFCVPAARASRVSVTETFSRGAQTFSRTLDIDVVDGADVSRAVDDIPLDAFGSAKRLHVTLAYRNGEATLEHALLLPGAVVLK